MNARDFFKFLKKTPERLFIIHYSSESLFDELEGAFSPRITSIAITQYQTRQTKSFSTHAIAEEIGVSRDAVEEQYDSIEAKLLEQFADFIRDRRVNHWIHWNMRNQTFGFEHLEHRYRVLHKKDPPFIPVENRINLNDVLKERFGEPYADHPLMESLMLLNGDRDPRFLTGQEESEAFKNKEFIRMHSSTISKVDLFCHFIRLATNGKLKTKGKNIGAKIDNALESRTSRATALATSIIGVPSTIYALLEILL